jgi:hypothetical protein
MSRNLEIEGYAQERVACPTCEAAAGQPCTALTGGHAQLRHPHRPRVQAYYQWRHDNYVTRTVARAPAPTEELREQVYGLLHSNPWRAEQ